MLTKITYLVLSLSLVLFSGCVSHNKYRDLETEFNSTRVQIEEDELAFRILQGQNEKLLKENIRLLEENEKLSLELNNKKIIVAQTENKISEPETVRDQLHSPYSILLSSCQQKKVFRGCYLIPKKLI